MIRGNTGPVVGRPDEAGGGHLPEVWRERKGKKKDEKREEEGKGAGQAGARQKKRADIICQV